MIEKQYAFIRERIGREMSKYKDGTDMVAHMYPKVDADKKSREPHGKLAVSVMLTCSSDLEEQARRFLKGQSIPFEEWEKEREQFARDTERSRDVDRTVRVNY